MSDDNKDDNNNIRMTRDRVFQGVKNEVQIWRNNQKNAISSFSSFNNMPVIKERSDIFHAAVWFGLGMSAVAKLSPGTALGSMAIRAAAPLFILDAATKSYAATHTKLMAEGQLQLEKNSQQFRSRLMTAVDNAERGFYTNPSYGKPLIDLLCELTQNDLYPSPEDASEFIRTIINDSGTVVTKIEPIRKQTEIALTQIATVVENVYRVSKYAPGLSGGKILKHTQNSGPFTQDDFKLSNCRLPQHLLATMVPGESVGYLRADPPRVQGSEKAHQKGDQFEVIADEQTLNDVLLNAWRYESEYQEGGVFSGAFNCKHTWVWQSSRPVDGRTLSRSHRGSFAAIKTTYAQLRSQYVVGTA